jgi:hypothetical protein
MCRNWFAKFTCGHDTGNSSGKLFVCPDREMCGPIVRSDYLSNQFCNPCLEKLREVAGDGVRVYALNETRCRQVRQVLNLAAQPYDSANINEFDGQLGEEDGSWIKLVTEFIGRYMAMPETPNPTEEEIRLYDQLRVAELAFTLMEHEAELQLEEGMDSRVLQARLRTRMRPLSIPANNSPCSICHKLMSVRHGDRDRAVTLPCSHVFGQDCLEARVSEWGRGTLFHCCPICGESFDMMTWLEQAEGIDPLNRGELPAAGSWLQVLKTAWNAGPE